MLKKRTGDPNAHAYDLFVIKPQITTNITYAKIIINQKYAHPCSIEDLDHRSIELVKTNLNFELKMIKGCARRLHKSL